MASTSPDDDDDLSAMYRDLKLASQEKRADNRAYSTNLLRERGVYFTAHNMGAHLVVMDRWDFWPGTGLWCERKGRPGRPKREGRGVHRLLKIIEKDSHAPAL